LPSDEIEPAEHIAQKDRFNFFRHGTDPPGDASQWAIPRTALPGCCVQPALRPHRVAQTQLAAGYVEAAP
jgi:hypothetical protein